MTYSKFPLIKKRKSEKITLEDYQPETDIGNNLRSYVPSEGLRHLIHSYNTVNGRNDIRDTVKKLRFARNGGHPIIFSLSYGIVNCGLSPLVSDLMQRGWISAVLIDEDLMIMDFELALSGKFIDYRREFFVSGRNIGLAEETGLFMNIAFKEGEKKTQGAGESVGEYLTGSKFRFNEFSILASAYRLNIPVTVFANPGTGRLHSHANYEGRIYGSMLDRDFILFSSVIAAAAKNGVLFADIMDRNRLDILSNSIVLTTGNGSEFKDFTLAVSEEIVNPSVRTDLESLGKSKKFSVYQMRTAAGLLIPILSSLILEEL